MSQANLPIVAMCRESTSYLLVKRYPLIQKMMKDYGYVMGDPIENEDYLGGGESYYTIALVPKNLANRVAMKVTDCIQTANKLDEQGFYKEADIITNLLQAQGEIK